MGLTGRDSDHQVGRENERSAHGELARRAVERIAEGRASDIDNAVDSARRELRLPDRVRRPTRAELRAHAQAHEESLGPEVRPRRLAATFNEILDLLAALEALVLQHDRDGSERPPPEVYGRAALGELDLDPVVHIRLTTTLSPAVIAAELVALGFDEPAFGTVNARLGRLDRIDTNSPLAAYRVVRIPPNLPVDLDRDLVRGTRVPHAGFEELSRRIPPSETL